MKIGVFDSGVGGLSVANAIEKSLPSHEVVFRNDKAHVPYGTRDPEEIHSLVTPIFNELIKSGCEVIVVACNTVSTTLINKLRHEFKIPLIAIEPMIKPASELTKSGVIAVFATPTTINSNRYKQLKSDYANSITVLEPDCSNWPFMIEHKAVNEKKVESSIEGVISQKADVIVLACTHFHWIEAEIIETSRGRAQVLQPEQAIITQLAKVLSRL